MQPASRAASHGSTRTRRWHWPVLAHAAGKRCRCWCSHTTYIHTHTHKSAHTHTHLHTRTRSAPRAQLVLCVPSDLPLGAAAPFPAAAPCVAQWVPPRLTHWHVGSHTDRGRARARARWANRVGCAAGGAVSGNRVLRNPFLKRSPHSIRKFAGRGPWVAARGCDRLGCVGCGGGWCWSDKRCFREGGLCGCGCDRLGCVGPTVGRRRLVLVGGRAARASPQLPLRSSAGAHSSATRRSPVSAVMSSRACSPNSAIMGSSSAANTHHTHHDNLGPLFSPFLLSEGGLSLVTLKGKEDNPV